MAHIYVKKNIHGLSYGLCHNGYLLSYRFVIAQENHISYLWTQVSSWLRLGDLWLQSTLAVINRWYSSTDICHINGNCVDILSFAWNIHVMALLIYCIGWYYCKECISRLQPFVRCVLTHDTRSTHFTCITSMRSDLVSVVNRNDMGPYVL